MALAGSPLLLDDDDEAGADFFDQLENDDLSQHHHGLPPPHPSEAMDCLEFDVLFPPSEPHAHGSLKQTTLLDGSTTDEHAVVEKIDGLEGAGAHAMIGQDRSLQPGKLVKEGSFRFATMNEQHLSDEDLSPNGCATLALTDQSLSSSELQPKSATQPKTAYKELQWSSFSDSMAAGDGSGAFGSFADLISALDKAKTIEMADSPSYLPTWTHGSAGGGLQEGIFDNLRNSTDETNLSPSMLHEVNQLAQTASQGVDWQPYNGQLQGTFTTPDNTFGGQGQQAGYGYSWENMYPGWYFDYSANEWRPTNSYDASVASVSTSVVTNKHVSTKGEGNYLFKDTDIAYPMTVQAEEKEKDWSKDESDWAMNHENAQQIAAWEAQYPGWHYDSHTQTWQQVSNDSNGWQPINNSSSHNRNDITLSDHLVHGTEISKEVQNASPSNWQQQELQAYKAYVKGPSFEPIAPTFASISSDSVSNSEFVGGSITNAEHASNAVYQLAFSNSQISKPLSGLQEWDSGVHSTGLYGQAGAYGNYNQSGLAISESNMYVQTSTAHTNTPQVSGSNAGRPTHPLVAFAFGGKLVIIKSMPCHNSDDLQVGSFANQQTWIPAVYTLSKVVIECNDRKERSGGTSYFTSLNRHGLSGPLVGGSFSTKELLKWIDERVSNCEVEEPECSNPDVLRLLWCVLKIACQNFGKLRSMLGSTNSQVEDGPEVALGKLLTSVKSEVSWMKGSGVSYDSLVSVPPEHQLQATALEMMNLLVVGKRKQALQEAQLGQLWGPALVLACQLGEKFYAETVTLMAQKQFAPGSPLQTLYLLLAGQGIDAITATPHFPVLSVGGFYSAGSAISIQDNIGAGLEDWQANVAIIAANHTKGDEQVTVHLGDCLWKARGEVAGAHICYLLAESNFESFSPTSRLCLVGADHFKYPRTFTTPLAIQRTELYEYAKVLGNPQFIVPAFQPYKLVYAHMLAEAGKMTEAIGYCQAVLKILKNAGRTSDVEYCRQAAMELEDRLRLYSQSGYGLNLAPGKIMGKLMSTIDSTIHKIIGGPPPPAEVHANGNFVTTFDSHQRIEKMGNIAPVSLIPSASMEPISDKMSGRSYVDVPFRSASEPDFNKNPKQETPSLTTSGGHSTESNNQSREQSNSSYLGRFRSQILTKAVGFIRPNKKEAKLGEENKFYYDQNLKMWVEKGVEPPAKETALPPPPTKFASSAEYSPLHLMCGTAGENHVSNSGSVSPSLGTPPLPPSSNHYSARGRLQGVRSRYVDTFNKGSSSLPAKAVENNLLPAATAVSAISPAKIFVPLDSQQFNCGSLRDHVMEPDDGNLIGDYKETENMQLPPKKVLHGSVGIQFMQRNSSADNVSKHASCVLPQAGEKVNDGNITKAVSWSGYSSSFEEADGSFITQTMGGNSRNVQSNGQEIEKIQFSNLYSFKDRKGIMDGFLPPPPCIEPPKLLDIGIAKSMLSVASYNSEHMEIAGSIPAMSGEMQEVEL